MAIKWKTSNKLISYPDAMDEMHTLVEGVKAGAVSNTVWFLEHSHVYTRGASTNKNELLSDSKIPVYQTNRGGKTTYHGPGQRVIYLIMDLLEVFIHSNQISKNMFGC